MYVLERTRIEPSAVALMLAVQVAINRAEAERVGAELDAARSHTAALERRADSLARAAVEAEKKLQEILDTAVAPEESSVQPLEPFALSPKDTSQIENCGTTEVYARLKRGEYQAVRDGSRTKILMSSIKARRARLQAAVIKPVMSLSQEQRRRRAAAKALQAAEIKPLPADTRSRRSSSKVDILK
jgi:hypothetical protein